MIVWAHPASRERFSSWTSCWDRCIIVGVGTGVRNTLAEVGHGGDSQVLSVSRQLLTGNCGCKELT